MRLSGHGHTIGSGLLSFHWRSAFTRSVISPSILCTLIVVFAQAVIFPPPPPPSVAVLFCCFLSSQCADAVESISVACLRSVWAKGNFSDHEDNWADGRRCEGVGFWGNKRRRRSWGKRVFSSGRGVGATRDGTGKGLSSGSLWGGYRVVGGFGAFEAPSSLLRSGFVWGRARRKASLLAKIEAV